MLRPAAMNIHQNLDQLLYGVHHRNGNVVITKEGKLVAALVDTVTYGCMQRRKDDKLQQVWAKLSKGFRICAKMSLKNLSTLKD